MRTTSRITRSLAALLAAAGLAVSPASPALAQEADGAKTSDQEQEQDQGNQDLVQLIQSAQKAYHGGRWYEAQMRYQDAYERAPADSKLKVHAAVGLSSLLWERGDYGAARTHIDEALELARELKMNSAIGRLLLTLGHIQASQGQLSSAESTLKNCVKLAGEQKDPVFGPLCKLNWRLVRKLQGEDVGSDADYKATIAKLKAVDTPLTAGMALSKTADLYAKSGDYGRAFNLVEQAGEQYGRAGSVPAKARNKLQKARLLQEAGEWTRARSKLKGLVNKFQQMGSKPALVQTLGLLGNDAGRRGDAGVAHKYYAKALKVAEATGSPQLIAKSRLALCDLASSAPKLVGGDTCEQAAETFETLGMPLLQAKAQAALGRRMQTTGELKKARKAFLAAVETLEKKVHPSLYGDALAHDMANLCQVEMQLEASGTFYRCREAVEKIEEAGVEDPPMRAATHYAAGVSAAREGNEEAGLEHLAKSVKLYESDEVEDPASLADALLRQGVLLKKTGDAEKAQEALGKSLEAVGDDSRLRAARIQIRVQYAQVLMARQKWKTGAEQLEQVIDDTKAAGDPGTQAWAWSALASVRLELDDEDGAEKALREALPLAKKAGDESLVKNVKGNLEQFEE